MAKCSLPEIVGLYQREELTLKRIAERYGLTYQRIHQILQSAGVEFRPRNRGPRPPQIDKETLERLYITERLCAREIGERLSIPAESVRLCMKKHGIPARPKGGKPLFPELWNLTIGESVILPKGPQKKPQLRFYQMAKNAGIRVSTKSIDGFRIRVTRIG